MPHSPEHFPSSPEETPERGVRKQANPPHYDLLGSIEFGKQMAEDRFDAITKETLHLCNGVSKLEIITPRLSPNEQFEIKTCIKEMLTNSTRVDGPTGTGRRLLEIRVGYSEAPDENGENDHPRLVVGFSDSDPGFSTDPGREVVAGAYDDEDIFQLSSTGRGGTMLEAYATALYHSPYTDTEGRVLGKTVWFEYNLSQPRLPMAEHEEPDLQGPYL